MKKQILIGFIVLFCSCSEKNKKTITEKLIVENHIESSEFQNILDSSNVKGAVLIYDLKENIYYSNDFEWAKAGKLPASTFKITNSIIALETEVVENDKTLFKWNGEERGLRIWEQDMTFREAFHLSCVPCYQDVARRIGSARMNAYLDKLEYGDMKLDVTSIDVFWLEGESKISQFQQIDFLKRFHEQKLPISSRTHAIMTDLMVIEENDAYKLCGKTGWSIRNGNNNGWFVGYLEIDKSTYFFAANVEPINEFSREAFVSSRKEVVYQALKQLELMDY